MGLVGVLAPASAVQRLGGRGRAGEESGLLLRRGGRAARPEGREAELALMGHHLVSLRVIAQ